MITSIEQEWGEFPERNDVLRAPAGNSTFIEKKTSALPATLRAHEYRNRAAVPDGKVSGIRLEKYPTPAAETDFKMHKTVCI